MQGVQSARGGGGGVTRKTALGHTTVTSNHLIDSFQLEFYKQSLHSEVEIIPPAQTGTAFMVHRFIYIFRLL